MSLERHAQIPPVASATFACRGTGAPQIQPRAGETGSRRSGKEYLDLLRSASGPRTVLSMVKSHEASAHGNGFGVRRTTPILLGAVVAGIALLAPTSHATLPPPPDHEFRGTTRDDRITATTENDLVYALGGNDVVRLRAGTDIVYGGRGHDTLFGGRGFDYLYGGRGADNVYGGSQGDRLSGGPGPDLLQPGRGVDKVHGNYGADSISLSPDGSRDVIDCGPGDDVVYLIDGKEEAALDTLVGCEEKAPIFE